jgi:methyl-accepting chemotaxis protein
MMSEIAEMYMQIGAAGIMAVLFAFTIMNIIKSQREQTEDLEQIKKDLTKLTTEMSNTMSIVIKLVDRMNVTDSTSQRHREDIVKEMNDLSDVLMEIKGNIARINHR